jgi:hypothetical protein
VRGVINKLANCMTAQELSVASLVPLNKCCCLETTAGAGHWITKYPGRNSKHFVIVDSLNFKDISTVNSYQIWHQYIARKSRIYEMEAWI